MVISTEIFLYYLLSLTNQSMYVMVIAEHKNEYKTWTKKGNCYSRKTWYKIPLLARIYITDFSTLQHPKQHKPKLDNYYLFLSVLWKQDNQNSLNDECLHKHKRFRYSLYRNYSFIIRSCNSCQQSLKISTLY